MLSLCGALTRLLLYDFVIPSIPELTIFMKEQDDSTNELFAKLRSKMSIRTRARKPFSMKFEWTHTFGREYEESFEPLCNSPHDVTISYNHSYILISHLDNHRIQVFDLHSKLLLTWFGMEFPLGLCIEENYDGSNHDAVICASGNYGQRKIRKFDMKWVDEMVMDGSYTVSTYISNPSSQQPTPQPTTPSMLPVATTSSNVMIQELTPHIWMSSCYFSDPQGIAMRGKQIFVCDADAECIKILHADTGNLVEMITLENGPYDLDFTPDGKYLLVCETGYSANRIVMLTLQHDHTPADDNFSMRNVKSVDEKWKMVKSFGKRGLASGEFSWCRSLVIDPVSKHVIVSDCLNNNVQIFTFEGKYVQSFGDRGIFQFNHPYGICLNQVSSELLVCDFRNQRVAVFK
ncbi:hypothetical protein C9374_008812 [Naegleria lovaniensis]|uniref:Uncharacterized protein n=1 Tax=Naegleria lovaniensis TaxID=51637 RepID=A0AA88KER4_NAELO|nr:uncharacterized protein C9374_008812 [Naegleria lovaniensis]KAG2377727.1 hypothetical protein C9374_008812 [Naegleria lovaniensis]